MTANGTNGGAFLNVLQCMLRPIARYCLRHSLPIQDFLESSKRALVDAAKDELGDDLKVSRIAAATGLQRRDVTRLLSEPDQFQRASGLVNRIIGQWRHDRRFRGRDGKPKVLALSVSEPFSFVSLVEAITHDIPAGSILFELERLGAVRKTSDSVELLLTAYVPKDSALEGYQMLGRDVGNLIEAVTENIEKKSEVKNLHVTVEFDNIRRDKLDEVRAWLLAEGSKFQKKVSDHLAQLDLDIKPAKQSTVGGVKVSLTLFSLVEKDVPKGSEL